MSRVHEKKYDVVVCRSGCAGFCAAIQAARTGLKTAIMDKVKKILRDNGAIVPEK